MYKYSNKKIATIQETIPEDRELKKFSKNTATDFEINQAINKALELLENQNILKQPNNSPAINRSCFSRLCKFITQSK